MVLDIPVVPYMILVATTSFDANTGSSIVQAAPSALPTRIPVLSPSTIFLDSHPTHVSESAAAEPGFTWCYKEDMGSPCVKASTPPGQCIDVGGADNDKASSASTNANSSRTLYQHGNCAGETLEIGPLQTINKLSDYKFDKLMSAYRCKWAPPPPTNVTCNILVTDAVNGPTMVSAGRRPHSVVLSSDSARGRLNLRALNGRIAASSFPFLGGTFDYPPDHSLGPGHSEYAELAGTGETPSGGQPIDSSTNSISASIGGSLPIEKWINPDGGEPQTTIALCALPSV
ncbi:hypothetical protein B0H17DRAFT_1218856 [Mycena rosella]|uniref:Uncharacterized protein n=1 Tax=Mycena rosella TaxID=1033263 RepID=A0AAD7FI30_MYCRO|nr:hypothetical protein B0H17DRAFT_1218856 [Mycena rosella]